MRGFAKRKINRNLLLNNKLKEMIDWFECKVRYAKIDEKSGKEKTVTESYLVDAVSFTEAEDRIFK